MYKQVFYIIFQTVDQWKLQNLTPYVNIPVFSHLEYIFKDARFFLGKSLITMKWNSPYHLPFIHVFTFSSAFV